MTLDESFDELGDLLLLTARQLSGSLEDTLQTALRNQAFGFWCIDTEKLIDGNVQGLSQFSERIGANGFGFAFPVRDDLLGDAELLSEIDL